MSVETSVSHVDEDDEAKLSKEKKSVAISLEDEEKKASLNKEKEKELDDKVEINIASKKEAEEKKEEKVGNKETTEESQSSSLQNKPLLVAINELARFNRIKHKFVLLDEIGPAHLKTFYVTLKLGTNTENEESYTATGLSIKKAQHNAADLALKQTKFKKPPVKSDHLQLTNKITSQLIKQNINSPTYSPTVKLNSIAIKFGLPATYSHSVVKHASPPQPQQASNDPAEMSVAVETATTLTTTTTTSAEATLESQASPASPSLESSMAEAAGPKNITIREFKTTRVQTAAQMYLMSNEEASNLKSINPVTQRPNTPYNNRNKKMKNYQNYINNGNQASVGYGGFGRNQQQYFNPRQNNHFNTTTMTGRTMRRGHQQFSVKLQFANKEFEGTGATLQSAKHDAAKRALEFISNTDDEILMNLKASAVAKASPIKMAPEEEKKDDKAAVGKKQPVKVEQKKIIKLEGNSIFGSNNTTTTNEKETKGSSKLEQNAESIGKSDIMLIYEYGHRLNKLVNFELVEESGPSHYKKFITKCIVENKSSSAASNPSLSSALTAAPGAATDIKPDTQTETPSEDRLEALGEGHSKKLSKHDSAKKMLEILNEKFAQQLAMPHDHYAAKSHYHGAKLNGIPYMNAGNNNRKTRQNRSARHHNNNHQLNFQQQQNYQMRPANPFNLHFKSGGMVVDGEPLQRKKKPSGRNIEKTEKMNPDYGKGSINAISRLMQIQQAKKEREPVFELAASCIDKKKGKMPSEFIMECRITTTAAAVSSAGVENGEAKTLKIEGKGSSKKMAKLKSAEAMLLLLGYESHPSHVIPTVLKPVLKTSLSSTSSSGASSNVFTDSAAAPSKPQCVVAISAASPSHDEEMTTSAATVLASSPTPSDEVAKINAQSIKEERISKLKTTTNVDSKQQQQQQQQHDSTNQEKAADKKVKFLVEETIKPPSGNRILIKKDSPIPNHTLNVNSISTAAEPANLTDKEAAKTNPAPTKLKIRTQANLHSQGLRRKIQEMKQQIKLNPDNSSTSNSLSSKFGDVGYVDQKKLHQIFKISFEMLELFESKKGMGDLEETKESYSTFYKQITEEILAKNNLSASLLRPDDFVDESFEEFCILNKNTSNADGKQDNAFFKVNYKKVLELLARIMGFKVSYQSLMGRDKSVFSYISLNILSSTDKPLNGQGTTHIESSNAAAYSTLKYLASKYPLKPIVTNNSSNLHIQQNQKQSPNGDTTTKMTATTNIIK